MLRTAGSEAETLGDEYISTEHLLLALHEVDSPAQEAMTASGVTREGLLSALSGIRGSQRVTDPNPEENPPYVVNRETGEVLKLDDLDAVGKYEAAL